MPSVYLTDQEWDLIDELKIKFYLSPYEDGEQCPYKKHKQRRLNLYDEIWVLEDGTGMCKGCLKRYLNSWMHQHRREIINNESEDG